MARSCSSHTNHTLGSGFDRQCLQSAHICGRPSASISSLLACSLRTCVWIHRKLPRRTKNSESYFLFKQSRTAPSSWQINAPVCRIIGTLNPSSKPTSRDRGKTVWPPACRVPPLADAAHKSQADIDPCFPGLAEGYEERHVYSEDDSLLLLLYYLTFL